MAPISVSMFCQKSHLRRLPGPGSVAAGTPPVRGLGQQLHSGEDGNTSPWGIWLGATG